VALLGKGAKAGGAMAVIAVLSIVIIASDLASYDRTGFVKIFGIGAAAGFCASMLAMFLMKRRAANLRLKNLVITVGALLGGAAILSADSVALYLVGRPGVDQKGVYLLNYAIGYFAVGVSMDTLRVLRAVRRQKSEK
jgi:hypothetical protein